MNVRQFPNSLHWIALIFAAVTHFYFATQRWDSEALIAHEFRQTQTAIIARYIDQQDNFGLRYETPILGKPWEFPLEVPIYQWLVVGVARLAGVTHVSAARGISLASFYLMLGAIWMLLGACRMERPWRCWVLVMTLCSPVYLFYSRSFLIDPLATAASAWFLASFVRQMDTRRWRWMGLTVLTASLAALIKSVVFFVWLVPAALWGAWVWGAQLWRGRDWKQATCTALWGAGPMVIPLGLLKWWVDRTDAIKAAHSSAWIFTSEALAKGNFGTFDLSSRLSQTTWNDLFARWNEVMVRPEPVVAILVLGFLGAGRWRLHLVAAAALFMTGQLVFPFAYAYQDYYFYAGAVFLAAAFGFGAVGAGAQARALGGGGGALCAFAEKLSGNLSPPVDGG